MYFMDSLGEIGKKWTGQVGNGRVKNVGIRDIRGVVWQSSAMEIYNICRLS